jgi:hypothetical protein
MVIKLFGILLSMFLLSVFNYYILKNIVIITFIFINTNLLIIIIQLLQYETNLKECYILCYYV